MEDVDVYFDDLTITHTGINVLLSTAYYPTAFANKRGGLGIIFNTIDNIDYIHGRKGRIYKMTKEAFFKAFE